MKDNHSYFKLYFFVIGILFICNQALSQNLRQKLLFNENWKFIKGDIKDAEKNSFNDQNWRTVDLPHDWSVEGPFSEEWASGTGYLPGGIGWYRKTFDLTKDQLSKKLYLYFDGVYKNSEVWINGNYLGKRPNGFISFYYDITKYVQPKGKNVITVKVDHTDFADSRWYTGSGIYRNVYLIAVNPVHIPIWGVTFTTPEVTADKAVAKVSVPLKKGKEVTVKSELLDQQNKVVASAQEQTKGLVGKDTEIALTLKVQNPALWSIEKPYLYQLRVSLISGGKSIDEVSEKVGFRSFKFDANNGFSLNGKNFKLKGVCIHDDAGALGGAVPRDVWFRRLKLLKEVGCNSIRMSHNPHQDYLYELCDEMGFIVQDEAFDEWEIGKNKWIKGWNVGQPGKDGYNKDFKEWAERDLTDMILRNRNHPSIIMWSIGNEIDYPNDPYSHEVLNTGRNPQIYGKGYQPDSPPANRLGEIAKKLVAAVRKADTTRLITAALAGVVMSNFTEYPEALDIVGYNYQEYRYFDDHKKYPERVIYGSENGKSYDAWMAVDTAPYISAQYLWTGYDFLGEARAWPTRTSGAGIIDMAGFPKPDFFYRKSLWTEEPMVYIGSSKIIPQGPTRQGFQRRGEPTWNWSSGDSVRVSCFTNCQEVELFLNNKSLGRKKLLDANQKVISWDLLFQPGALLVKGYKDGAEITNAQLLSSSEPADIQAKEDRKAIKANKDDVSHIEIAITDNKGTICYESENEINIEIEGPGRIIGIENGSLTSHEDYKDNKHKVYHGKLLVYVQAEKPGLIKLNIKSPGLPSKTIEIKAE